MYSDEKREFLAILTLIGLPQLMLDHWLRPIDEFIKKIKQIQRKIEKTAATVDEVDTPMAVLGITAYSELMIHSEMDEVG